MSKIAEKAALKAYPPKRKEVSMTGAIYTVVGGDFERRIFQEGYETAEKDLALTIEDIERIDIMLCGTRANKHGAFTFSKLSDEQYAEVLKRYLEAKK